MTEDYWGMLVASIEEMEGQAKKVIETIGRSFPPLHFEEQLRKGEPDEKWEPRDRVLLYATQVLRLAEGYGQCQSADELRLVTLMLGRASGSLNVELSHLPLWMKYQNATQAGRDRGWQKKLEAFKRIETLCRYIIQNGPPPPKGEFGKTNPDRTRYFQKFNRATGFGISIDTFNRYEEALTPGELEYSRRLIAEAALARFIAAHAAEVCNVSRAQRLKFHRKFKKETGFDIPVQTFHMYVEFEAEFPGMAVADFEGRTVPY